MSNTLIVFFRQVRESALDLWIQATGRSLIPLSTIPGVILIDSFETGFECGWQNDARAIMGNDDWHVSHFCSLGDWAGNVTDTLTDFRFDEVPIGYGDAFNQSLFRYYTRFMLVVSEMLTDFQDLFMEVFNVKDRSVVRTKMSHATINVQDVFEYINSICKHKVGQQGSTSTNLHQCNHHLPFFFEDCGQPSTFTKPLSVGNLTETTPDGIIVPKLESLVWAVIRGYEALDNEIQNDHSKFAAFVSDKGTPTP